MIKISCIIPVMPGTFPQKVVDALKRVSTPMDQLEVLVAEGRQPSKQRNEAVKQAGGEFLYFLDDDSFVDPDCINQGLEYFSKKENVAAVGGPAVTYEEATFLERCFGDVTGAYWGGFITRYRVHPIGKPRAVNGEELILCNILMRKECYSVLGGLKEQLFHSETEMMKRVRQNGFSIYYNPDMVVRRTRRKTIPAFIYQIFDYSYGRTKHIFQGFRVFDVFFFVPSIFTMALISLPFFHPPWLIMLFCVYGALIVGNTVMISWRNKNPLMLIVLPFLFFIMHISYGIGFLLGILRVNWNQLFKSKPPQDIKITKVNLTA